MNTNLYRSFEKDGVSSFNRLVPELMSNLMHNLPGMAYRCINDGDWTMLFISEGCHSLTGYKPEELLYNKHTTYDDLIIEEDRDLVRKAVEEGVRTRAQFHMEYRITKKCGEVVWVWEQGNAVYNPGSDSVYLDGFIACIHSRKTMEEELRRLTEELSFYNAIKDKFFNLIAHDLQNPIYAIISMADFIVQNRDSLNLDQIIDFSGAINSSARSVNDELINMMEWSRLHSGHTKIRRSMVSFRKLVEELLDDLRKQSVDKQIRFDLDIDNQLNLHTDHKLLTHIMRNLVSNAVKFSDHGQSVLIRASLEGAFAKILIEDHGIGMPRSMLSKLFDIDVSNSRAGTANEQGKGIGLALVKAYVSKLGGDMEIRSRLQKGTVVEFSIPAQQCEASPET